MTKWVYPQGDFHSPDLRSNGCGAASSIAALVRASDGAWKPATDDGTAAARYRVARSGATPAQFRTRGLTPTEVFRSLSAVRPSDARMNLPVQLRRGVAVRQALLPQLRRIGGGALVAVDYGVAQDAGLGVGSFRGGHWVFVDDPDDEVRVADPLRHAITRWPVDVLVEGMERFGTRPWGNGRGDAVVVWPWLTWRDAYPVMKASRDKARRERDQAQAALALCQANGGAPADQLAAARAQGIADAAAAAAAVR